MACGGAALATLNQVYDQNRQVSQLVSAPILQTAQVVRQTLDAMEKLKFRQVGLERQLFSCQAEKMAGKGNCFTFRKDLTPEGLRELAALESGGYTRMDEPTPAPAIGGRRVCFLYSARIGMIELLEGGGA